jgi:hypothetical protein
VRKDWMAEPDELDLERGYTRVSLATVDDSDVGRGGILSRTIMRSLDDPRCSLPTDAALLAAWRAEDAAILRRPTRSVG